MSANLDQLPQAQRVLRSPTVVRRRRIGALALAVLGVSGAFAGLITLQLPGDMVSETGLTSYQLKMISIAQAGVLTLMAVAMGHWATPRMGLRSIIVDGDPPVSTTILLFLVIGAVGGAVFWLIDAALADQLTPLGAFQSDKESQLADLEAFATPIMRLAYGGVTEEILARYGLMSGLAIAVSIIVKHRSTALGLAIILSSFIFGLGHLPAIVAFFPDAPSIFLVKTVILNTAIAALFAIVFVQHSLEASMASHIGFHLALVAIG